MPFSDVVTGFTVAVFGFDVDVLVVAAGFFVVLGLLLEDEEAVFDAGFVVLDELLLLVVPAFNVLEFPLFDAIVLLPFCFGVRACILASSDAVM
jgi:hypothetical protein